MRILASTCLLILLPQFASHAAFGAGAAPGGGVAGGHASGAPGVAAGAAPRAAVGGTTSGFFTPTLAPGTAANLSGGGFAGSGIGDPINGGAFVPGQLPSFSMLPANPGIYPYAGGGSIGPMGALGQMCSLAASTFANIAGAKAAADQIEAGVWNGMDGKSEFAPGADRGAWGRLGAAFNSKLSGKCQQKFITKDGQLGQWGLGMYGHIQEHANQFLSHTPRDMGKYCRKYDSFDNDTKARFWTFLMMNMANPESTCNPTAVGHGPNGDAIGLFQLEARACNAPGVGLNVSSSQLLDPRINIKCAVAVLGKEMTHRDTITVGTSRGFGGTYWAPLRDDNQRRLASGSSMVRGDVNASVSFTHNLIGQFNECNTGADASKNPNAGAGAAPAPAAK